MERRSHELYAGTAGTMEAVRLYRMFARSEATPQLKHVEFYGDGDSKSHVAVKYIYRKGRVHKLQWIGHVHERVGRPLRKLK